MPRTPRNSGVTRMERTTSAPLSQVIDELLPVVAASASHDVTCARQSRKFGIRGGELRPAALGVALEDAHEALRRSERQRPQHHRVHDGEDGGVDADAEREREDGNGGEGRVLAQPSGGVAHVARPRRGNGQSGRPPGHDRGRAPPLEVAELAGQGVGRAARVLQRLVGVELAEDAGVRFRGVETARDQRAIAIVEVLGQLFEHRGVERRIDAPLDESAPDFGFPVAHGGSVFRLLARE